MKITKKLRDTSTRHLSYAGKLQVVNVVIFFSIKLLELSVFTAQSIVKLVEKKCPEFLWGGTADKKRISLVAWANVCWPKAKRGVNIKSCILWNITAVSKLIWWIQQHPELL